MLTQQLLSTFLNLHDLSNNLGSPPTNRVILDVPTYTPRLLKADNPT